MWGASSEGVRRTARGAGAAAAGQALVLTIHRRKPTPETQQLCFQAPISLCNRMITYSLPDPSSIRGATHDIWQAVVFDHCTLAC